MNLSQRIWTFVLLAAIVGSFAVNRVDVVNRASQARADDVASCVRANTRAALTAASQRFTGDFVRKRGFPEIADSFGEYAYGSTTYLAISQYIDDPQNATRVHTIDVRGEEATVLTTRAEELIIAGCAQAFHATGDEIPTDFPALGLQP